MDSSAARVVEQYWALMQGNDFDAVGAVLADDFVFEMPQSGERIRGARNYAAMNTGYPAHGRWRFTVQRIVDGGGTVVSEVDVSDGVQGGRAISFFEIRGGRVARLVEYWPEPFAPRPERAHLVEPMG
jgi:ketosteroid isomerase-like protein